MVAFWGQPIQELELGRINYNVEFQHLCELGIMSMEDGYDKGSNTSGHCKLIQSQKEGDTYRTKIAYYDDGLILLTFMPKMHSRVATSFVSPSEFKAIANNALYLNKFNSSWVRLACVTCHFVILLSQLGASIARAVI